MSAEQEVLALAEEYAGWCAKYSLEFHYGTSKAYTAHVGIERDKALHALQTELRRLDALVAQQAAEFERLMAQRDELLHALRGLMTGNEWKDLQGIEAWHRKQMPSDAALSAARAAIAKAGDQP